MTTITDEKVGTVENLKKLVEVLGGRETAELLGCSHSHVTEMIRKNSGRIVYELAAKQLLRDFNEDEIQEHVYLVRVPDSKNPGFVHMCDAMSIKPSLIK